MRVAVIDIGSNSIKALVAEPDGPFGIRPVHESTLEVRISTGISGSPPVLSDSSIQKGVAAVESLYRECQSVENVSQTRIVATSAVRSAVNGEEFIRLIHARTGVLPGILSGQEEADGIAYGVRTDPAIRGAFNQFTVFDLGGGSLELIRFEEDHVQYRTSFPLGSVRLTEKFIRHPDGPVPQNEANALKNFIRETIANSGFPVSPPLVGCSGGLTTWRAIRAAAAGLNIREGSAVFTHQDIAYMAGEVLSHDYGHRVAKLRIPAQRADIFPAALLTFQVLLELANTLEIRHSMHNLPYGIAWEALSDKLQDCS